MFPTPPLQLPSDEELHFLKHQTPEYHTRKNISYYPRAKRLLGIKGPAAIEQRTQAILADYQDRVESCLQQLIPSFTPGWASATSSLRVFEENNRDIPIRSRSDRLHIDAGTYGASRGRLILRFLTNLDDEEIARLYGATVDVLDRWTAVRIEETGDGFPEKVTAFHPDMAVHGKYGEPCPVCGAPVQRIVHGGRETNYCPGCQTGGKILADRALSRILKDDWPKTLDELEE